MPKWNCLIPLWNFSGFPKGVGWDSARWIMRIIKYVSKSRTQSLVFNDLEVMPSASPNNPTPTVWLRFPGWEELFLFSGQGCCLGFRAGFQVPVILERLPSVLRRPAEAAHALSPLVAEDGCVRASRVMGKAWALLRAPQTGPSRAVFSGTKAKPSKQRYLQNSTNTVCSQVKYIVWWLV